MLPLYVYARAYAQRKKKPNKQGRGRQIAKKRAQNWEKIEIKYAGKKKMSFHYTSPKKKVLRDLRKVRKGEGKGINR